MASLQWEQRCSELTSAFGKPDPRMGYGTCGQRHDLWLWPLRCAVAIRMEGADIRSAKRDARRVALAGSGHFGQARR